MVLGREMLPHTQAWAAQATAQPLGSREAPAWQGEGEAQIQSPEPLPAFGHWKALNLSVQLF
jgi:hypothetical protein